MEGEGGESKKGEVEDGGGREEGYTGKREEKGVE